MQELIYKYCKKFNIKYISVGCNANHITVTSNVEQLWGPGGDRYVVTPMFIVPPMLSSLCAVWNVVKNKQTIDLLLNIKEMFAEPTASSDVPVECSNCSMMNECEGCVVHSTETHEMCECCPVSMEH